jgi:pilus assembly protein Flp/PilA
MLNAIRRFMKEEEGASAAEYALLVGLVTVIIVGAVSALSNSISGALTTAANVIAS